MVKKMKEPRIKVDNFRTCFDCMDFNCEVKKKYEIKNLLKIQEIHKVLLCNQKRIGGANLQVLELYDERKLIEEKKMQLIKKRLPLRKKLK